MCDGRNIFKITSDILKEYEGVWMFLQGSAAFIALLIAIAIPTIITQRAEQEKTLSELVAYRNISYISQRLAIRVMGQVARSEDVSAVGIEFETCYPGLLSIPLGSIRPAYLTDSFVEIQHMVRRAEHFSKNTAPISEIGNSIGRANAALNRLDGYLFEHGARKNSDGYFTI